MPRIVMGNEVALWREVPVGNRVLTVSNIITRAEAHDPVFMREQRRHFDVLIARGLAAMKEEDHASLN